MYINEIPRIILKSLVSLYADDTRLYMCTTKHMEERDPEDRHSHDLPQMVQWEMVWLVKFNMAEPKIVHFHHQ